MESNSLPHGLASRSPAHPGERRKNPRFDMRFPVYLRAMGDLWTVSETADVSATGALFVTNRPLLLNVSIEYVLTFPPDLTKAPERLRVRFFGMVLRCERIPGGNVAFGVAVSKTAYRYLTREEAASFDEMEQKLSTGASSLPKEQALKTGS